MRTILLGRPITGDEALSWGLLCDLVADADLMKQALSAATELAGRGQEALQFAKEAIGRGMSSLHDVTFCRPSFPVTLTLARPISPSPADSLCRDDALERTLYYATFGTEEKRRGVDAFLAKRAKPAGDTTTTGAGAPCS